ncbi:hypothetical protein D3C71_189070 [compost metagenome]
MTEVLRDAEYWKNLFLKSELGVVRFVPPDQDIPVPTDEERFLVRDASRRYLLAAGHVEPESRKAQERAMRDQGTFSDILEFPEVEQFDGMDLPGSVLVNESMGDFVVAATGLSYDTYVAVIYEDVIVGKNTPDCALADYIRYVEMEYFVASEIIYADRDPDLLAYEASQAGGRDD